MSSLTTSAKHTGGPRQCIVEGKIEGMQASKLCYYLYSIYYLLDLYDLFSAQYKFVPFTTINLILSPHPLLTTVLLLFFSFCRFDTFRFYV